MNETEQVLENSRRVLDAYNLNKKRKEGQRLLELLPQGHGSGLDADMVDGLHAKELINRASGTVGGGGSGGGVTDHGGLTGLLDNDHPQYHKESHVTFVAVGVEVAF